jgi:hypothetical protein
VVSIARDGLRWLLLDQLLHQRLEGSLATDSRQNMVGIENG